MYEKLEIGLLKQKFFESKEFLGIDHSPVSESTYNQKKYFLKNKSIGSRMTRFRLPVQAKMC